jgi:hypothetical protein
MHVVGWAVVVIPLILLRLFGFEDVQQMLVQNCYLVAKSQQVYVKLFTCFIVSKLPQVAKVYYIAEK